ncbi:MAG: alanine racemase, partial [Actinobacteria bacterium]|nr:alanine racemase [Actinomycetota bacterium]
MRWAWAEVNLDAVAHNVRLIREVVAPSAVWAVVKADAYGHGAVPVARAALSAGAEGLCVALVSEGVELRAAGLTTPILILSQSPSEEFDLVVSHQLTPAVYCRESIEALAQAAARAGQADYPVHLK